MIRKTIATAIAVAAMAVGLLAHDGHVHKIRGTISKVDKTQIEVQTTDGKKTVITMNDKTQILKGKVKAEAVDLKEGARVVIDAEGDPLVAKTLRLGAARSKKS